MNARRYRYSVLLPLALLLSLGCDASANAAVTSNEVSIVAELSQSPVAFDGRTRVDVTVEWVGPADRYIAAWPEAPSIDGLQIVGSRQETASWVEDGAQKTRQTFSWIVAPERIGIAHVGVVETLVRDALTGDSRRISTSPVPVEVVRVAKGGRFRWLQVVYGGVALVIVVVVAGWIRARTRHKAKIRHKQITLGQRKLAEELNAIRQARESGDAPAFFDRVFSALRSIIALRFGIRTDGMSAKELSNAVEISSIDESEKTAYVDLLSNLDRRRYAAKQENVDSNEMMRLETLLRLAAMLIREEHNVG